MSQAYRPAYGSSSAVTISPASTATSGTLTAGVESDAIDNTGTSYFDYLLSGFITTGSSPTNDTHIQICVVGIMNDTTWPDVFDGTASSETVTSAKIKNAICMVLADITVDATSNLAYNFGPRSVARCFDGTMPKKFVVFVTHNTNVNLNSTAGNHAIYITPVYATVG